MKTEKEKLNDGTPYLLGGIELKKDRRKAKNLLHRLNVTEYRMTKAARLILGELLPNAGNNLYIEPPFFLRLWLQYFLWRKCIFQRKLCYSR